MEMVPIACTGTRVSLPRGHSSTHSINITCKKCIERVIEHLDEQKAVLEANLKVAVDDKTQFKITLRERAKENLRTWIKNNTEPDPEVMERIKYS